MGTTCAVGQFAYNGVGELVARCGAAHVPGPDAPADNVVQGRVDAQRSVRQSDVAEHQYGRPDNARRVGHGARRARRHGVVLVRVRVHGTVPLARVVRTARAVVAHRTEHGHLGPVRNGRHRGRAAGQCTARRAGERPVQAGREQHVVPVRVVDHPQTERVQLFLFVIHVRKTCARPLAGPQECTVRHAHRVGLVQRRDAVVAVLRGVFERELGHRLGPRPHNRLDGLHYACAMNNNRTNDRRAKSTHLLGVTTRGAFCELCHPITNTNQCNYYICFYYI